LTGDATNTSSAFMHRNNNLQSVGATSNFQSYDASAVSYQNYVLPALQACSTAMAANKGVVSYGGLRWGIGGMVQGLMNTVVTPNNANFRWNGCGFRTELGNQSILSNAQSSHPGGVNVLFTDGSVRFVKDTVQQKVWYALGTKANNDIVSADQY
jgi:prepilin-type processing-associated H-X9-DG protein